MTPTDIVDELWRTRKVRVDRRKIDLADPIKRIGRYSVPIDVFQDVRVEVKTLVVPEGGELPPDEELEAMAAQEAAAARGEDAPAEELQEEAASGAPEPAEETQVPEDALDRPAQASPEDGAEDETGLPAA